MNNEEFLSLIGDSFKKYLYTGSRSNEKLKILHGGIAKDLQNRLGNDYQICSLGIGNGKEVKLNGRYTEKVVDVTIKKAGKSVAGIGVKFIMQNYSQNSNNYFENMLGETANIHCANIPYFQIFIIPDTLPYFEDGGTIKKWEKFSHHNSEKYMVLSKDDFESLRHTPVKTLLFVVHLPEIEVEINKKVDYLNYYRKMDTICISKSNNDYGKFSNALIYNDYEEFAKKVVYYILFL